MRQTRSWFTAVLSMSMAMSCGGDDDEAPRRPRERPANAASEGPLYEETGELAEADPSDPRGHYDDHFVAVGANDRLLIELTSSAFDPILEVTPPDMGTLVNDDWQGDRTRSQIELLASGAGRMKVRVRSYARDGSGQYQLRVRRLAAEAGQVADGASVDVPVLSAGQTVDGELAAGDHTLSDGGFFDSFVIRSEGPVRIAITPNGGATPRTTLVGPDGLTMEPNEGYYHAPTAGTYRLQVIGASGVRYRVAVTNTSAEAAPLLARVHHQFNEILNAIQEAGNEPRPARPDDAPASEALVVRVGDRLDGNLASDDPRLPSGEYFDSYELTVAQPGSDVAIELESQGFDTFLRVDGPNGAHFENDDSGGTRNSRVEVPLRDPGTYRIVATSYRAGETGAYQLKILPNDRAQPDAARAGNEQIIEGELAQGDTTLQSGEFVDEHRFTWPAGARIHIEARSTAFDSYLIVHPPGGGQQQDNDDMKPGQSLNAGLDIQTQQAGEWRVLVTSYRAGETGAYQLAIGGGSGGPPSNVPQPQPNPQPNPRPQPNQPPQAGGRTQQGTLAQGDATLQSGEFQDTYEMTFTARSAVQIRLESSAFDTYLIVRPPSGRQEDNDDLAPPSTNSGLDIPVAEPGTYRIMVTSYRPGETGAYTLRISEGASVVEPPSQPPRPGEPPRPPGAGGGRVWGLFVGIEDYPGNDNDLPECANDARKLAEALRNQGSMPADQEFLLVNEQATVAAVRNALTSIAQRIRPDDVLFFFFSGHGGQTSSSQDPRELDSMDEYLVLHDGNLMDDEAGRLFDAIRARVALVAIDACFAGGFAKDVITRPGRVGMFSSEEDVTSDLAPRFQAGGYLSHFLRLGIEGEADNDPRNAILTVGELTHYTWVQFGRHASDVRMSMGYQHLVVDRGAVRAGEVLWATRP
jgi:hypothetical protein